MIGWSMYTNYPLHHFLPGDVIAVKEGGEQYSHLSNGASCLRTGTAISGRDEELPR